MFDGPIELAHRTRIEQLVTAHHRILDTTCQPIAYHIMYRRVTSGIHKKNVNQHRKRGFQEAASETHTKSAQEIWKHLVSMRVPVGNRNRGARPLNYLLNDQGIPVQTAHQRAQVFAKHFGAIEVASPMDPKDLCFSAMNRQKQNIEQMANPAPNDLITRSEIEYAIRKCKQGKAAGHDGIPAEYYKRDPSRMARMLIPLAIKQSGLLCEPYQHKEGEAKDLQKSGQQKPQSAEAHRAVLLADNIGKIFRGAARPRLVKHAVENLLPTQCGGLPEDQLSSRHTWLERSSKDASKENPTGQSC
jgi:hypothetical protein